MHDLIDLGIRVCCDIPHDGLTRLPECLAEVTFQNFRHQIGRAAQSCNLLQQRCTFRARFHGAFERFRLSTDAAKARQRTLLSSGECGMKPLDLAGNYILWGVCQSPLNWLCKNGFLCNWHCPDFKPQA